MADITQIQVGSTTYDIRDGKHGSYYVKGTQTASTNAWTGNLLDVDELYEGLIIDYWLPFAGISSLGATLTLTLKGGVSSGAINVYYGSTTRVTTHLPALYVGQFIYQTVTISGANYTGWWMLRSYLDGNTTDIVNLYQGSGAYKANSTVYRYQLLFQMDKHGNRLTPLNNTSNATGTTKPMLTNVEFDPFGDIFYYNSTSTVNADANMTTTLYYHRNGIDLRYTFNCGQTLTAHKDFYLVVSPQSNGKVKIANSTPWAQDLPSTNDGYLYIFLGRTYSAYQFVLYTDHPVYYHDGTSVRRLVDIDLATTSNSGLMSATDKTKLDGLDASDFAPASHVHSAADITSGTLSAAHGGTGQTTLNDAANSLINALTEGTAAAGRNDYIVAQYVNGGTTTKTYHRRKVSNILAAMNSSDVTTALGFTPSANDHTHGNISNAGAITSDTAVANGDKIIVADSSDSSKLIRTGITFDGSTTTKALTPKGTWETFTKASDLGTMAAINDAPSDDKEYARKNGVWSEVVGSTYTLPIASSSTLGGIKVGTNLSINSSTGVLSATDTKYTANTTSIGSASAGTAIPADDITSWDAGSTPTLGTAIPADDITSWSAGTLPDATYDSETETLQFTFGSLPSLAYTAKSIPNVTAVGSVPTLNYTAKSIPNISVTATTVATGITAS